VSEITQAVIDDARDDLAGALPLVQHALATLWNEQPGGVAGGHRLTLAAYEQAGRLATRCAAKRC
jgi:hypothetical protein